MHNPSRTECVLCRPRPAPPRNRVFAFPVCNEAYRDWNRCYQHLMQTGHATHLNAPTPRVLQQRCADHPFRRWTRQGAPEHPPIYGPSAGRFDPHRGPPPPQWPPQRHY